MAASLGLAVEHIEPSWKLVPLSLIKFQLARMLGLKPGRAAGGEPGRAAGQPVRRHAPRAAQAHSRAQIDAMSDRLSLAQIAVLVAYAAAMTSGQLLFKLAALRAAPEAHARSGLLLNRYFLAALALYAALTVLWVWILTFTPLSRAYPFVALAFALTPALGGLVFAEPISLRLVVGIALILCGLLFVAG